VQSALRLRQWVLACHVQEPDSIKHRRSHSSLDLMLPPAPVLQLLLPLVLLLLLVLLPLLLLLLRLLIVLLFVRFLAQGDKAHILFAPQVLESRTLNHPES